MKAILLYVSVLCVGMCVSAVFFFFYSVGQAQFCWSLTPSTGQKQESVAYTCVCTMMHTDATWTFWFMSSSSCIWSSVGSQITNRLSATHDIHQNHVDLSFCWDPELLHCDSHWGPVTDPSQKKSALHFPPLSMLLWVMSATVILWNIVAKQIKHIHLYFFSWAWAGLCSHLCCVVEVRCMCGQKNRKKRDLSGFKVFLGTFLLTCLFFSEKQRIWGLF